MTALNKRALRQTAEKAQEHGVFNMDIHSQTVLALLDENYRLTAERDALRENIGGDNTRAAADIYFQLVEECEIPPGGSLVGYIDDIKERLSSAGKRIAELEAPTTNINIPDGWALVPINPSMAQEYAGYKTLTDTGKMSRLMKTRIANIYRAMITAAAGIGVKGE
ncbi:TPA: hypothetical protein ACGRST_001529 [Escherichia coli]